MENYTYIYIYITKISLREICLEFLSFSFSLSLAFYTIISHFLLTIDSIELIPFTVAYFSFISI